MPLPKTDCVVAPIRKLLKVEKSIWPRVNASEVKTAWLKRTSAPARRACLPRRIQTVSATAASAGQDRNGRRIRVEGLPGKRVPRIDQIIHVGIELVFLETRDARAGVLAVGLGRGNQELAVGQPGVEERQSRWVNGGGKLAVQPRPERAQPSSGRTVVGRTRRDQHPGRNGAQQGRPVSLARPA